MPLRSETRRLPRRNHHQEGLGFLFLTTQGGQRPKVVWPSDLASVVRGRQEPDLTVGAGHLVVGLGADGPRDNAPLEMWGR